VSGGDFVSMIEERGLQEDCVWEKKKKKKKVVFGEKKKVEIRVQQ
jgi:hypothetical protein